jgi:ribose 5-phosphate isomerase B
MPIHDIYLGADHAGADLKKAVMQAFANSELTFHDLTPGPTKPGDDYPDAAIAVAQAVRGQKGARGVLFCGSAEGVCIAANKFDGIRAGIGYSVEAARSLRADDDGNILCLPGKLPVIGDPLEIVQAFIQTPFNPEKRFVRRLRKIFGIEQHN